MITAMAPQRPAEAAEVGHPFMFALSGIAVLVLATVVVGVDQARWPRC